jgi:four helix bundle protein
MASIKRFEEIEVWQLARKFDFEVFQVVENSKIARDFKLHDQMLGSSSSIMDNIAEGFGRSGNKEFGQFLYISKGSCTELKSQSYRAFDRGYISEDILNKFCLKLDEINNKIGAFASYLDASNYKGPKYYRRSSADKN